jgi:uncharacterized membrane protein YsdA (DUF1294 family)
MPFLALFAFAAIAAGAIHFWQVPPLAMVIYAVGSVLCFVLYTVDKAAARAGRWRTAENLLLLSGLACGWPGAVLAQSLWRHKSSKRSFQARFWVTVLVNVAAFIYLASPLSPLRRL